MYLYYILTFSSGFLQKSKEKTKFKFINLSIFILHVHNINIIQYLITKNKRIKRIYYSVI